jgi:hypothetical protein
MISVEKSQAKRSPVIAINQCAWNYIAIVLQTANFVWTVIAKIVTIIWSMKQNGVGQ